MTVNKLKKPIKFFLGTVAALSAVLVILLLILQLGFVQTKLTKYFTKKLSSQLKTELSIEKVRISFFKGVVLKGLYLEDLQKDTLIYIGELSVFPKGLSIFSEKINFRKVSVDRMYLNLYEIEPDLTNLQFVIDKFSDTTQTDTNAVFIMSINNVEITNSRFKYKTINPPKIDGMNFDDADISDINLSTNKLNIVNSDIAANIKNFSFKDKSGFALNNLKVSKLKINSESISTDELLLKTGNSNIDLKDFGFEYKNWEAFSDFMTDVSINAVFNDSCRFQISDLSYFAPELKGFSQSIIINGKARGTVSDLQADSLLVKYEDALFLYLTAHLQNLPDYKKLIFDVDIKELTADLTSIKKFVLPGDSAPLINFPTELADIEQISYTGKSKGSMFNFITNGKLYSDFGNIAVDVSVFRDSLSMFKVDGQFSGENLNIAKVFSDKDLGNLTFSQNFELSYLNTKKIILKTSGTIDSVSYKGYRYEKIKLFADMNGDMFDTISIQINQPEIKADFLGKLNLSKKNPEFKFSLDVDTADLKKLNIDKHGKKSLLIFNIAGDFKGFTADDFEGVIKSKSKFKYINDSLNLNVKNFEIVSKNDYQNGKPVKNINLKSDILDAQITNTGTFSDFEIKIQNLLNKYFPVYFDKIIDKNDKVYEFAENIRTKILIKQPDVLSNIFYPDAKIAENTKINVFYGFADDSLNIILTSKKFETAGVALQDFYSVIYTSNQKLYTSAGGSQIKFPGEYFLENIDITASTENNISDFDLSWNNFNDTENYSGNIKGQFGITKELDKTKYYSKIYNSDFSVADSVWNIEYSEFYIDSTFISINALKIYNKKQQVFVDGIISETEGDFLFIDLKNFNIANLNLVTGEDLQLDGTLNGSTKLVHLYKNPFIISDDSVKDLKINDVELGNVYVNTKWNNSDENLQINLFNKKTNARGNEFVKDSVTGNYWPGKDSISFKVTLNEILMKTFSGYYDEYVEFNPNSRLSGKIDIFGKLSDIKYNGELFLSRTAFRVLYINTSYTVDGKMQITFDNNLIGIKPATLNSSRSAGTGILKGKILHDNFNEMKLDLGLTVKNFQILNTPATDSSYFYGTAYATGNINVSGTIENTIVDIDLKTDKNTNFYIPLQSSESLSDETAFMKFKSDTVINPFEKEIKKSEYNADLSGIIMTMNLTVTPDAQIQMVMDESTGDIIKAKGEGNLKIDIDTRGDFNMYGVYNIVEGDYLFTLKSVISKHFLISQGGKITWQGDPYEADIDLEAVYPLKKVSLYNLLLDEIYRDVKTKVDCNIDMTGKLMNPEINFSINLPESDESVTRRIESLEPEDINKQFLSLLIIGGFQPLPGLSQETVTSTPVNTGEILTNQLNRWLSDISDEFDVGLNYQSGDQITGDELEVALSTQLWDDRITINGNVGVGGKNKEDINTSNTNNFIGELEAELKLNKQGSLKMKMFNKANDDVVTDKGPYTQGVGLFWRHEFNFFTNLKNKNKLDTVNLKD